MIRRDPVRELERLAALHQAGHLSADEFFVQKRRILNDMTAGTDSRTRGRFHDARRVAFRAAGVMAALMPLGLARSQRLVRELGWGAALAMGLAFVAATALTAFLARWWGLWSTEEEVERAKGSGNYSWWRHSGRQILVGLLGLGVFAFGASLFV